MKFLSRCKYMSPLNVSFPFMRLLNSRRGHAAGQYGGLSRQLLMGFFFKFSFSLFTSFLSPALEKSPSSVSPRPLCQETRGLSVARATAEHRQKGEREKPLILTFSQAIEDHVNQDVGSTPAGSVTAERRRRLRRPC